MSNCIIKAALFLTGVISLNLASSIVQAQQIPSGDLGNTTPNLRLSPGQLNNLEPIRQPSFSTESGSGSQQFFRQGREQLYLLPEEKSEPILKLDKTIEAEGLNYQDLQPQRLDSDN